MRTHIFQRSALLLATLLLTAPLVASASNGGTLSGYAWSDTIGWISLSGGNYGISFDANGVASGYAWSDSIGWISANSSDLAGCPSGTCTAKLSGNNFSGWLRALAGGSSQSGNWDGFISLSGSNYGPTISGNSVTGFAWGSDVVGWTDFSLATVSFICAPYYTCSGSQVQYVDSSCHVATLATCVAPAYCSAGSSSCLYPPITFQGGSAGHLSAHPAVVAPGLTSKLFWDVTNVSSCTISGTNGDSWRCNGAQNECASPSGGQKTSPITGAVTYTLSCTGLPNATPASLSESVTVNLTPTFREI